MSEDQADLSPNAKELKEAVKQALIEVLGETQIKVNVADAVTQLGRTARVPVRNYLTGEYRFVEFLKERSRRAASQTFDFADDHMRDALFHMDQFLVIRSKMEEIGSTGDTILDFGVYKGASTRALAAIFPRHAIHGFDSFEGLPEDWNHALKASFSDAAGLIPEAPKNVTFHKGWFDDTAPAWASSNRRAKIALLRIDCDIYSSTKTIFDSIGPMIGSGSWICFDELIGYYGWQGHEHKAFEEFLKARSLKAEYVAYGLTYAIARIV